MPRNLKKVALVFPVLFLAGCFLLEEISKEPTPSNRSGGEPPIVGRWLSGGSTISPPIAYGSPAVWDNEVFNTDPSSFSLDSTKSSIEIKKAGYYAVHFHLKAGQLKTSLWGERAATITLANIRDRAKVVILSDSVLYGIATHDCSVTARFNVGDKLQVLIQSGIIGGTFTEGYIEIYKLK